MSYELILEGGDVREFAERVAMAPFGGAADHVDESAPYIRAVAETSWMYVNEVTGVYFTMEVDQAIEEDEPAQGSSSEPYITCKIAYLCPTFFVDEAVPVILSLAKALRWTVRDPQLGDIVLAPDDVDRGAIRARWQETTRDWIRRIPDGEPPLPRMDPVESAAMWRHNTRLTGLMQLEDELFVPRMFPYRRNIDPKWALRCITWGGGLAMLFPPADIVAIVMQPRWGPIPLGKKQLRFAAYSAFVGALSELVHPEDDMLRLSVDDAPRATERVKRLERLSDSYERIGYDGFVDVF